MASIANQGASECLCLMVIRRDDLCLQAALTVVCRAGTLLTPVPASQRGVRAACIISQKGMALSICKVAAVLLSLSI